MYYNIAGSVGFRQFQLVIGWFYLVSAGSSGFRWLQLVSGGFRLFLILVSTEIDLLKFIWFISSFIHVEQSQK